MSPRRRYLATTLGVVAVALAYGGLHGRADRPGPRLPSPPPGSSRAVPAPVPPSAREILDRGAEIAITAEQAARLEALDRGWRAESAGLRAELAAALAELARFMDERAGRGASIAEIQQRAAGFSALSAELREQRRRHGHAAAVVLTEEQRARIAEGRGHEASRS